MGKEVKAAERDKNATDAKKPNKKQSRIQDFKKKKLQAAMELVGSSSEGESDAESSVDSEEAAMAGDNKRKTGKQQVDDPKNKLKLDKFHRPIQKMKPTDGQKKNKPVKRQIRDV